MNHLSSAAKPARNPHQTLRQPVLSGKATRKSSRGRTASGKPNPIDVHVGNRVRIRRTLLGMSQEKLGEAIGLTFQQVQKYERGANRIGSSRLYDLSQVLDVPVSYFFDDMPEDVTAASPRRIRGAVADPAVDFDADPLTKRQTLELARAFHRIANPAARLRLFELAKVLAGDDSQHSDQADA